MVWFKIWEKDEQDYMHVIGLMPKKKDIFWKEKNKGLRYHYDKIIKSNCMFLQLKTYFYVITRNGKW